LEVACGTGLMTRALRERLYLGEPVYRWVHGESDDLPGLIVDRYNALVVVQSVAPFYAEHAEVLAELILKTPGIETVYADIAGEHRWFGRQPGPYTCTVHGLTFRVDPQAGQKTGLFLDQRENWRRIMPFAPGARVLDGYCYRGAWALHAAQAGAAEVLGVDTSQPALAAAEQNAAENGYAGRCRFEAADIQAVLARGEQWNAIILDPPALAKSRTQVQKALGLYQFLNRDAIKSLAPNGALITSSCSHFVSPEAFLETLKRAANAARRRMRLLSLSGAAPDHPVLLAMPETAYLKCAVLQALD
ncbi:MAG: class I SAM-dependent methyltransferase, partial [Candidatus Hydrogenedentales bacterium]